MLMSVDTYHHPLREIVIVGSKDDPAMKDALGRLRRSFITNRVIVVVDPSDEGFIASPPLAQGKTAIGGETTFYLCQNFACQSPTTDFNAFAAQLGMTAQ